MSNLRSHFYLVVFCSNLLMLGSRQSHVFSPETYSALFIFGDSLFDAGNNNYLNITNAFFRANFIPYGETFFKFPTGRFSDGRIIPDFIAQYEKLPLLQPYLQPGNHCYPYGVNFASAGAGALGETAQGTVINLKSQLDHFQDVAKELRKKLGDPESKLLISESLYLFSIGGNDYAFTKNSSAFHSFTPQEFVGIVIGNLTDVIKEIYKNGGRKFGFVNIGAFGCAPLTRALNGSGGCLQELTVLIQLHNIALSDVLKNLQTELQEFEYSVLDFYTLLNERINNPSKYGFKEGKVACCGSGPYRGTQSCGRISEKEYELCDNPSNYLFFDSVHLTEKAYNQLSEIMWAGSPDVVWPYNLQTLLN